MSKLSKALCLGLIAAAIPATTSAQTDTAPMVVKQASAPAAASLPANTQVSLTINDTITTKGNHFKAGDTFDLTVVRDVRYGNYVVIPRGSRGVGRITWMTSKGAFGKSGKMEIDIEYVEVAGRRIPLSGHYRQEGEGNTVATIGAVVAVGVFGGLVTGNSGVIPQGRELLARTKEDLPLAIEGPIPEIASAALPVTAISAAPAGRRRNPNFVPPPVPVVGLNSARVRCVTCQ